MERVIKFVIICLNIVHLVYCQRPHNLNSSMGMGVTYGVDPSSPSPANNPNSILHAASRAGSDSDITYNSAFHINNSHVGSNNRMSKISELNYRLRQTNGSLITMPNAVPNGNQKPLSSYNRLSNQKLKAHMEKQYLTATQVPRFPTLAPTTTRQPYPNHPPSSGSDEDIGLKCDFETQCKWSWDEKLGEDGFQVVSALDMTNKARTNQWPTPTTDGNNNQAGHFLYSRLLPNSTMLTLKSQQYSMSFDSCELKLSLHQSRMFQGSLKIVLVQSNVSYVPSEIMGDNSERWTPREFRIGRLGNHFHILLEVVPKIEEGHIGHIAIDNIKMENCFPLPISSAECTVPRMFKCMSNQSEGCITMDKVCDINQDCADNSDETKDCDKMPYGSRCDFEKDTCGWENTGRAIMDWTRHVGETPTEKTGPDYDHTKTYLRKDGDQIDVTGHYMVVNMNQHANDSEKQKLVGFASNAVMNSPIFNPPPRVHSNATSQYRNSCMVRVYVHQFGPNAGSFNLSVVEMKDKENITTTLWWSARTFDSSWQRVTQVLPSITSRYYLQFEARMGMRIYSDVAVDDFSLSPECFGLNIPEELLDGYNYWDPRYDDYKDIHKDFEDKKLLELTNCGARGRFGPTKENCTAVYKGTGMETEIQISSEKNFKGTQIWTVPNEDYYTLIVKGAGGGLGSAGVGSSRGAIVTTVIEFHKGERIYNLVGQAGEHACIKSIGRRDESCEPQGENLPSVYKVYQVKNMNISDGSGGGGGASWVFLMNGAKELIPIAVAGGGGGLGIGSFNDDIQHGRGVEEDGTNRTGSLYSPDRRKAGPGGGWHDNNATVYNSMTGMSLLSGATGGIACYQRGIHGYGGFGGGGGGCTRGGGGGGFSGGDSIDVSSNGQGGTSFISVTRGIEAFSSVQEAANSGAGAVIIIPAVVGCGCDYKCVALDEYRSETACICPKGWVLNPFNLTQCEMDPTIENSATITMLIGIFVVVFILLLLALTFLLFVLYNRYQRKKQAQQRHKMLLEQDLQLSRLRNTPDNITSPMVNIDYGGDGIINGNVDVKSLPQVARESLRLIKALGQGAFGEVYQGLYKHRDGDTVEMPVAVKTLPEMSTGQAESDFLMEAAIMAKFNHPNIVHLIGVCFDRHPRFIVLELLAGGDLKNFLREGRNRPERPSQLTMKDLIFCALDVAKGCRYLESKRFIHRDIAARNCLLSSKGPGRVVKIADFGMARDIYRSDYYKKGGKAMLPIKWMPPEAFLDGLFTSKTDIWSFGVLLWEVFSLGLMPYTGLPNREVMQLVTGGGRLDSPPGCPLAIYRIMADCWNPTPENRPTFSSLLERLTTCSQDAEIMNAPLPSFHRPVSNTNERDTTIMRPPGHDDFCLQVPNSDYLIPLQGPRSVLERLMNEATGVTLPESLTTMTAPTNTTSELGKNKSWETSFTIPNPISANQPSVNSTEKLQKESSTERLISLDTPQQTPTTVQPPPLSFDTPLSALNNNEQDALSLDGNVAQQQQQQIANGPVNGSSVTMNGTALGGTPPKQPITLDPSTLNNVKQGGTSYANVKMMNANNLSELQDKLCSTTNNIQAPFTIQGFKDRYKNENHSEISC